MEWSRVLWWSWFLKTWCCRMLTKYLPWVKRRIPSGCWQVIRIIRSYLWTSIQQWSVLVLVKRCTILHILCRPSKSFSTCNFWLSFSARSSFLSRSCCMSLFLSRYLFGLIAFSAGVLFLFASLIDSFSVYTGLFGAPQVGFVSAMVSSIMVIWKDSKSSPAVAVLRS